MTTTTIKDIEKYPNEWVAIDEGNHKVVGHGKTLREAALDAKSKGYEKVVFMLMPDPSSHYVLYLFSL